MKTLSQKDLTSRREFDWQVVTRMSGQAGCTFTAHRTAGDAQDGKRPITDIKDARHALHYRGEFHIRTLIGPGKYSPVTIIRVDASSTRYPFAEPSGWVVRSGQSRTPWSPHFAEGLPVCNGSGWSVDGTKTMGHYLIHLARLLNWDEDLRNEYGGYNPDAVAWWRKHVKGPLNPDPHYPALPVDLLYGEINTQDAGGFRTSGSGTKSTTGGQFRRVG